MQALLEQRFWSKQPQIITGVNWANPIARGLVNAVVNCIDYAANVVQPGKLLGQSNTGRLQTATAVYDAKTDVAPITIIGHLRMVSDNLDYNGLVYGTYPGIYQQIAISLQGGSLYVINRQGIPTSNILGSYTLPLDAVFGLSGVIGGGSDISWYMNGVNQGVSSAGGTNAFTQYSGDQFYIASASNVGAESVGKSSAFAFRWTRVLTNAEIKSVSDNPWQLFRALL